MKFEEVAYNSDAYRLTLGLRDRVLRQPLGLSVYEDDLEAEARARHFALFDGDELIACLVITPLDSGRVKLGQMAVAPSHQGRGLGTHLIQAVETKLRAAGIAEIQLAARLTAKSFYRRLGYRESGEEFVHVTIPHVVMRKKVNCEL